MTARRQEIDILGLDPSSTATGLALLHVEAILENGTALRLNWRLDLFGVVRSARRDSLERMMVIVEAVTQTMRAADPAAVVLEIPSGKVARRLRGRGAGLSVYGMAVGMTFAAAAGTLGPDVLEPVSELDWTAGDPKARRLSRIRAAWPAYRKWAAAGHDPGGDAGDAIGLASWGAERWRRSLIGLGPFPRGVPAPVPAVSNIARVMAGGSIWFSELN